jgi:hypothetical protein
MLQVPFMEQLVPQLQQQSTWQQLLLKQQEQQGTPLR